MTTLRHYTEVVRVNGRPATIRVDILDDGRPKFDLTSIEYLDSDVRERLGRLYAAVEATDPEPYRSPMPAILSILALIGSISCAILGAATFGTDPLTLVPFLGGMAWWCASVALGAYAYKAIRAALR